MRNVMIKKNKCLAALLAVTLMSLSSCVDDKGNYDYRQLAEIEIEGIPQVTEVLAHIDNIVVAPTIKADGKEIAPADGRYEVLYRLGHKGMGSFGYDPETGKVQVWKEYKPENGFGISIPANFNTGLYTLWMTVTDNETGAVTSKQYDVSIGSTTYEGWLVLCNEGNDNRVRLDMISKINSSRIEAIHDISAGLPDLHDATCILAFPQGSTPGDQIHLLSRSGSFNIDSETMECDPADDEFNSNYFAFDPHETIVKEDLFSASSYDWLQKYKICFGENGNGYVFVDGAGGAAYSTAINTLEEGTDVQFKLAPFAGFNFSRPWASDKAANILFYDSTNRRFMLFLGGSNFGGSDRMQLSVIAEPTAEETNLFSYSTGKDMVYMESTRRSNGLVYAVLQDPATGSRSLYGINMGGTRPVQELYIEDVEAPEFDNATQFAFDSRFPLMFYSAGGNLYCYNLGTRQTNKLPTGLASGEVITKIKFNLYRTPVYTSLSDQSEEFMNQQYRLVVCSFDASKGDNGGKVTFFDVDGVSSTASAAEHYDGFAKVQDIIYRERCE
ncbi:MAG: PKD-like family lipoprotein [Prevotellaceae bacterium]|nr:PKD-like family lipoprotein [Prevotellaceae bacterium]